MFHTRKFLSYHPPERFKDHSLLVKEKNRIVAVFPAALRVVEDENVLVSHPGASFGGFVCSEDLSIAMAFRLVEGLLDHCNSHKFDRIDVTLPPMIYLARPSNYLDFALYKHGFEYRKREISSIIPLDFGVDDILKNFKPESRTASRKSQKLGVKIRESDDIASFYPILERNLGMRHQVNPTHTLPELQQLQKLFPERIRHFGAFLDDKMIAGVTNFLCNDRVVLAFYISHDEDYQKYRPVNYLFHEIISWSIRNNFKFLDYGIFTVNEDPNWGLGKFKESFGARGVFRDSLYKQL